MTSQVSPTPTNCQSCHSYAPHADYTCDQHQSSCSKSPTLWFCSSNGSPKCAACPPQTQSPPIAIHPKMALTTNQHALPASGNTLMTSTTASLSTCGMEPQHMPDTLQKVASSIQTVTSYVCHNWQRPQGCSQPHNSAKHMCSGCGSASHGAQKCPKAEPHSSSNTI